MAAGSGHGFGEDAPPDDVRPQASPSTPLIEQPVLPTDGPSGDGQRASADESGLKTETAGTQSSDAPPGSGTPSKGQSTKSKHRKRGLSFVRELPFLLLVAFVLALLIKT